jgi:hypothetical protein
MIGTNETGAFQVGAFLTFIATACNIFEIAHRNLRHTSGAREQCQGKSYTFEDLFKRIGGM